MGQAVAAEAVAINTTNWTIFYRGAIDDQLTEGATKPAARNNFLQNAVTEFLEGKPIATAHSKVSGCLINFPDDPKTEATQTVSYSEEVAPLLQKKCAGCHRWR